MRLRLGKRVAALLPLMCLQAAAALADGDRGTVSLLVENDRVASTDRHYTHGTRLSWLSAEGGVPGWVRKMAGTVPLVDPDHLTHVGVAIGQSMFTPEDTGTRELVRGDRPYAGWLYAGFALLSDTGSRLDRVELNIGVVGPASFAMDVQKAWHDLIGVSRPQGWDNQLRNEPGIVLILERQWGKLIDFEVAGLGVDLRPHVGGRLGNVFTYVAAGATVRFGKGLPDDNGPPRIRPSVPGSTAFGTRGRFGWYLFGGFEGRLVVRNIFLDGNTFADSHSLSRKPLVGDFQAGAALTYGPVRLTYTHVFRTIEFDGQRRADRFGAISLSVNF
jgi:lipid A 3-O-deacylase